MRAGQPGCIGSRSMAVTRAAYGCPSAKSTLTMITLTKPIERKGWRSTSVTRRRKAEQDSSNACWTASGTQGDPSDKGSARGDLGIAI